MAVNKVVLGGESLIDLTADTVTADTLGDGVTAHDASGQVITGTMKSGGMSRQVGETFHSLIPLDSSIVGIHVNDGSLLTVGGLYDDAITKIAAKKETNPSLFCTEEEFQASVTKYGVCGKFVYTEGVSLRIPKDNNLSYVVLSENLPSDLTYASLENIAKEQAALITQHIDASMLQELPVGSEINFYGNEVPDKCLLMDGREVSRTVYSELFAKIGTIYGEGDGSTTFNLPDRITYPYGRGVTAENVGLKFDAGLPNLIGDSSGCVWSSNDDNRQNPTNGVFYQVKTVDNGEHSAQVWAQNEGVRRVIDRFDASRGNSIYGNSDSVTPPSLGYLPCIKAFSSVIQDSSVTISELMETVRNLEQTMLLKAHPIKSYYWSDDPTDPSELFGGTWERVTGKFLYAADDDYAVGTTGGEKTHVLTIKEMPKHGHIVDIFTGDPSSAKYTAKTLNNDSVTFSDAAGRGTVGNNYSWQASSFKTYGERNNVQGSGDPCGNAELVGGSQSHNNMPPFQASYCWQRTA